MRTTRNISISKELDGKAIDLIDYLRELGYERNYSSIISECVLMSVDKIRENYKFITQKTDRK